MNTSNAKHTSGPWFVNDNTENQYGQLTVDSQNDGAIAICFTMGRDEVGAPLECIANAKLIAAAPEMFNALLGFKRAWDEGRLLSGSEADAMLAAIKKVNGVAA